MDQNPAISYFQTESEVDLSKGLPSGPFLKEAIVRRWETRLARARGERTINLEVTRDIYSTCYGCAQSGPASSSSRMKTTARPAMRRRMHL